MPDAPKLPPTRPKHTPPPRASTTDRGYGTGHQKARKVYLARHPLCERCHEAWSEHLHHRDRDTSNRDPSNLEALCARCHLAEHRKG